MTKSISSLVLPAVSVYIIIISYLTSLLVLPASSTLHNRIIPANFTTTIYSIKYHDTGIKDRLTIGVNSTDWSRSRVIISFDFESYTKEITALKQSNASLGILDRATLDLSVIDAFLPQSQVYCQSESRGRSSFTPVYHSLRLYLSPVLRKWDPETVDHIFAINKTAGSKSKWRTPMLDTDGRDAKFPIAYVDITNGMPRNYSIDVTHIARAWISEPEANRGLLLWLRQDGLVPRCQSLVSIASSRDSISNAGAPSITLHFQGKLPLVDKVIILKLTKTIPLVHAMSFMFLR